MTDHISRMAQAAAWSVERRTSVRVFVETTKGDGQFSDMPKVKLKKWHRGTRCNAPGLARSIGCPVGLLPTHDPQIDLALPTDGL